MRGGGSRLQVSLIAGALLVAAGSGLPFGSAASEGIAGRIVFQDGQPAAGANITLTPGGFSAVASEDGSFDLAVPAGSYLFTARSGNDSVTRPVSVPAGKTTFMIVTITRRASAAGGLTLTPFLYLIAGMVAVIIAGFYVNRRMAETGIDLDRSVLGGARVRKPFRRRKKRRPPT